MRIRYQRQPNNVTCGQTCVAMLASKPVVEVCKDMRNKGSTSIRSIRKLLRSYGWQTANFTRTTNWAILPKDCLVSLQYRRLNGKGHLRTKHLALRVNGKLYDPFYGIDPAYTNTDLEGFMVVWR